MCVKQITANAQQTGLTTEHAEAMGGGFNRPRQNEPASAMAFHLPYTSDPTWRTYSKCVEMARLLGTTSS